MTIIICSLKIIFLISTSSNEICGFFYSKRHNGIMGTDFKFSSDTGLGKACGAVACNSNHTVSDTKTPCISYESGAAGPEAWALRGKIILCGQFRNVPEIKFCSRRLAEIFIKGTEFLNIAEPIDQDEMLAKTKEVLAEYTRRGVLWDLVFWAKFSGNGYYSIH